MALIKEYVTREPDKRGIRHWVSFKYDPRFVEKVKQIPSAFRSFDPTTKMWGFNDRGWNLFCAISEVKFLGDMLESGDVSYKPRKIDTSLEKVDWEKFRRPPTGDLPELNLWEIQKVGISQILRNKGHGLFYEMGLGKTYTAICAGKELLDRGEVKQVLVISLVSGVLKGWATTLDRMGYSYTILADEKLVDRPRIYSEIKTDFVLTLYTSVLSKGPVGRAKKKKFSQVFRDKVKKAPQMIVADELHKLGDVGSKTFKEFKVMAQSAKYRVALTGTIIKSTPDKALLPLRFIAPKVFSNKGVFEEAFTVKESNGYGMKIVGYKNLSRLKELIHGYGCVALKKDHLKDLPELLPTKTLLVETSKDSISVVKSIRSDDSLKALLHKQGVDYAKLQDLFIRIHQALICPSVYSDKLSAKNSLETVISILESVEGKTIIFTTLIPAVYEISNYLKNNGIKNVACCGGIKELEIDKRVKEFNESDDCNVMVATVQKMGTGRDDLKVAQNVIVYDFNMVAGDMKQAIDRLHRAGQKHRVSVFEILQDNPFSRYQREKVKLQQNIINQTEDYKLMAKDSYELVELLKLAMESNLFGGKK